MNKVKARSQTKIVEAEKVTKSSKPASSGALKTAPKKTAPKKNLRTNTKTRTVKSDVSAAVALAAKPAARKTPVKSVVKKTPATSRTPKASGKAATKVDSKIKKESKAKKPATKNPKLFRDSFTFPEADYALFKTLKQRALEAGSKIKKSELLRAGMAALAAMPRVDLMKALSGVERIKTGRAAKK